MHRCPSKLQLIFYKTPHNKSFLIRFSDRVSCKLLNVFVVELSITKFALMLVYEHKMLVFLQSIDWDLIWSFSVAPVVHYKPNHLYCNIYICLFYKDEGLTYIDFVMKTLFAYCDLSYGTIYHSILKWC